jgi:hypothetical protein
VGAQLTLGVASLRIADGLVGIALAAAVIAGLFTRSRLPAGARRSDQPPNSRKRHEQRSIRQSCTVCASQKHVHGGASD